MRCARLPCGIHISNIDCSSRCIEGLQAPLSKSDSNFFNHVASEDYVYFLSSILDQIKKEYASIPSSSLFVDLITAYSLQVPECALLPIFRSICTQRRDLHFVVPRSSHSQELSCDGFPRWICYSLYHFGSAGSAYCAYFVEGTRIVYLGCSSPLESLTDILN